MKHKRKNVGKKILAVALSGATAMSVMPAYVAKAADPVATVTKNGSTTSYTSVSKAWDAVKDGGTIDLLKDWNTKTEYSDERLIISEKAKVTINLNGHIINRHKAGASSSDSKKNGETLCVNKGASVTINGGNTSLEHEGYIESKDGVWYEQNGHKGKVLKGGVIAGGYSTNGAGGIHIKENVNLTLNDVTIAGNKADEHYGDGYGGGIAIYGKNGSVKLNNSKVIYNYAETSGGGIYADAGYNNILLENGSEVSYNMADNYYGGGIYLDDDHSQVSLGDDCAITGNKAQYGGGIYAADDYMTVTLSNTAKISDNTAEKDGGAAYFNYSKVKVKGGEITGNKAKKGGGGIYLQSNSNPVSTDSATLANTNYSKNEARNGDGGAIHSEQEHVNISGCTIKNNNAGDTGGGVYIYNQGNAITSSEITDNTATKNGGGVYVKGAEDLGLSGKVVINDNSLTNGTRNNLSLATQGAMKARLTSTASAGSKVGITLKTDGEQRISKEAGHYIESIYFSDKENQYVEWGDDRILYMKNGTKQQTPEKQVDAEEKEEKDNIIKGYFSYSSWEEADKDLDSVFYYSDQYFSNPTVYNPQLATMSMCLAMSAFNSREGNPGSTFNKDVKAATDYTLKSKNVVKLMTDIGIEKDNIYLSDTYTEKPGTRTIGVAIGQKKLNETDGTILVPVAVRGGGYESEWTSNVTLGTGEVNKEAAGFADAADQVFAQVQSYVENYNLTDAVNAGKVKFWVTGFSRAGATANLTAKRVIDAYTDKNNEVYAYCMEAPQGAYSEAQQNVTSDGVHDYTSIHNCINYNDPVPKVAPVGMNFVRYGVDHVFNNPDTSKETVKKVKQQLAMIAPEMTYDDYYHVGTVMPLDYGASSFVGMDSSLIRKVGSVKKGAPKNNGEFADVLLEKLQEWAVPSREDFATVDENHDLRKDTSLEKVSFERALQLVMPIAFSKSDDELEKLMDVATDRANDLSTVSIYAGPILGKWDKQDDATKKKWIWTKLWDVIVEPSGGDGIASQLSTQELRDLKTAWPTLLDTVFSFVSEDYNFKEWTSYVGHGGLNLLGTLLYNADSLIQGHYHEINYAWLRQEDPNYNNEKEIVKISSKITPEVNYSLDKSKYRGDQILKLDTKKNGEENAAAIYYKLKTTVNGQTSETTWKPYNKQILLPTGVDANGNQVEAKYEVSTKAALADKKGVETTKTYTIQPEDPITILIKDQTGEKVTTYASVKGKETTITAPDVDGKFFTEWSSDDITIDEKDKTKQSLTFTIPEDEKESTITITAKYQDKINEVEITNLEEPDPEKQFGTSADVTLTGEAEEGSETGTSIQTESYAVKRVKIESNGDTEYDSNQAAGYAAKGIKVEGNDETESIVTTEKPEYDSEYRAVVVLRPEAGKCEFAPADEIKVSVNGKELENPRVEQKNDGSYWVFSDTTTTEMSTFESAEDVAITGETGTELQDLTLPEDILIKATDGYKLAKVKEGTLKSEDYDKNQPGIYHATAEIDLTGTGVEAKTKVVPTVNITVTLESNVSDDIPKLSADSPKQNKYKGTQSVKFENAGAGKSIYYKVEKIDDIGEVKESEPFLAYTDGSTIELKQPDKEGDTTNYQITAYIKSNGSADGTKVSFLYSICNPYKVTVNYTDTGMSGWKEDAQVQTYFPDEYVTIIAPEETAEVFYKWDNTDAVKEIKGFKATNKSIEVGQLKNNITITAVYNPVLAEANLKIKKPSAGEKMAEKVDECQIKVENTYNLETDFGRILSIESWSPQATSEIAAVDQAYTAKVSMPFVSKMQIGDEEKEMIFKTSPDLTIHVTDEEGNPVTSKVELTDTSISVYATFDKTSKIKATGIKALDNITDVKHGTRKEDILEKLPKEVAVQLVNGTEENGEVSWSLSEYNPDNVADQVITATGMVDVPDYVDATDIQKVDGSIPVTVKIYIKGAEKAQSPEVNLPSGIYIGEQKVKLSCNTKDAVIYYTTDGTTPTENSSRYTDGEEIALDTNTQLMAISVKEGMQNSSVASYGYNIHNHVDADKDGKCDGIIIKNRDGEEITEACDTVFLGRSTDTTDEKSVYGDVVEDDGNGVIYVKVDAEDIVEKSDSDSEDAELKWKYSNEIYPTTDLKYAYAPEGSSETVSHGYIFAGWYQMEKTEKTDDEENTTTETTMKAYDQMPATTAYAKFVDETVLGVKAQLSKTTTPNSKKTNIRFTSSVDTKDYQKVQFAVEYNGKNKMYEASALYEKIYSSIDGKIVENDPNSIFANQTSNYFVSAKMNNVPKSEFDAKIKVTPYWITADGTKVKGTTVEKSVNDSPQMQKNQNGVTKVNNSTERMNRSWFHRFFEMLKHVFENADKTGWGQIF